MSAKVEEVAKAIRDVCQGRGYLVSIPENDRLWESLSRVAGTSIREPTREMIKAGERSLGCFGEVTDVEAIWKDMIDELLK